MTIYVILAILCVCAGMTASVYFFGTGGKRANIFKDIYYSIEEIDGMAVLYTKTGDYSSIMKMENPVLKYSADTDGYYDFVNAFTALVGSLGEGYAIHKQDVFSRKSFKDESNDNHEFLSESYFRYFTGREYTEGSTYLIITQENKKSNLFSYDEKKWKDFLTKSRKALDILHDSGMKAEFLGKEAASEYVDRFFAQNFRDTHFAVDNFKVGDEYMEMGDKECKMFSLVDVDSVGLPGFIKPYTNIEVNNSVMPIDFVSILDNIPGTRSVVYNQIIYVPGQKKELAMLDKKKNRHASIPNPSNTMAVEDIKKVQEVIARESKMLVYTHFNLIVTCDKGVDFQKPTNYLENALGVLGVHISKRAYNQLELFVNSFPGNCYAMNKEYDRFLTLSDAAMCLMFKEHVLHSEDTPLKVYYTDRQGVPVAIDISGKEGKVKLTDNSNFFCLGPSGSGKSFHMNSVIRQLYEQNTDVVMVDTGNSYEGLCEYVGGRYIAYTKENPITMNPFKITDIEYEQGFGEKKNFLKSLIFLIYKGNKEVEKIEDTIINQVLVEYYDAYFHPFKKFTNEERETIKEQLLLEDKMSGEYDKYSDEIASKYGMDNIELDESIQAAIAADPELERKHREATERRVGKLNALVADAAATEGEKENAKNALMRLMPELTRKGYMAKLDKRIDAMEQRKKKMQITSLSFNTFYEYACQRIPQICAERHINFEIHEFSALLSVFYKGGELEKTLNNDVDASLFDEKFIVFEIDAIKDDPLLFPVVTLIIMDVFLQKMRIKKNRKVLVIEEAWKAIASPTMAEYIKYMYKTCRKFWGMVGVVTQEIQDIISSPIVKEAIINNSDVMMLLDQSKFKERFSEIKAILGLSDVECKKLFTVNRLDNKEGRSFFREVFIRRSTVSGVYGVEEPRECYMTYTTERAEKEALKLYKRELKCSHQVAIEAYVRDWNRSGINKSLAFAQKVNAAGKVLNLPDPGK